jgi:hypothetical protein
VIELEAEKGEPPPTIALAMIASYRAQEEAVLNGTLKAVYGPMNFFERGIWKSQGRWHWDEERLRLRMEARMGT